MRELVIDSFAGGGGASTGIEIALGLPMPPRGIVGWMVHRGNRKGN